MYPLELLLIEHKRRIYLDIWNGQKLRDVPAQMDDNAAEALPGALPTEKTSPDPSTRPSNEAEKVLPEQS